MLAEPEPEEIIAAAIEQHVLGDPAVLVLAIIEQLWEAGYDICPRPSSFADE